MVPDPLQAHGGISTRHATRDDHDFLRRLHHESMRESVEATWGWDEAQQDQFFERSFEQLNAEILLLDDERVGMISVMSTPQEMFINQIQILSAYQGRGIGTTALTSILALAREASLPVGLQVLKLNRARKLYERLGFEVTGETRWHYRMRKEYPAPGPRGE